MAYSNKSSFLISNTKVKKIKKLKLDLPTEVFVEVFKSGVFLIFESMVKYKIYSPNVEVRYNKEGHFLEGYFLKRWKVKVYACLKTWIRAIQKYLKSPTFEYKVSIFYKKFPIKVTQITCEKSGRIGLSVYNYLNLKKALNVYFNSIKELKIENANLIVVKSKDDVGVGSDLNKLVALRRKTALKKLDRRKFTDGFFVEKSILYE